MPIDYIFNAFATLLVTIDPFGLAPIFLALTAGAHPEMRRLVAVRASVIAMAVLLAFAFLGAGILTFLGISMPAFRMSALSGIGRLALGTSLAVVHLPVAM